MPKNKRTKARFSKSLTRSGRCFSVQKGSTEDQFNLGSVQKFADGLSKSASCQPISGIRSASKVSPVSPLLASTNDDERWKDVNPNSCIGSEFVSGNALLEFGVDVLGEYNTGEASNKANTKSVDDTDAINESANVNCNAVLPKTVSNPIPPSGSLKISSNFDPVTKSIETGNFLSENCLGDGLISKMKEDLIGVGVKSPVMQQNSADVFGFGNKNSIDVVGIASENLPASIFSVPTSVVPINLPAVRLNSPSNPAIPEIDVAINPTKSVKSHILLPKQSYASCFSSLPRCAGAYCPRDFSTSSENPHPPAEIIQEGTSFWKDHLVGFFLDSVAPIIDVRDQCRRAWNLRGELRVSVVNGMYYFKFSIMEERRKVLESDPAIIGGKPFIITSWSVSVEKARECVTSIHVWTIFTRIPSVLQTLLGLNWLASRIGNFKCFDVNTESRKNLIFAKALIEITPNKPLPKKLKVTIEGYDFYVDIQFSWQPEICTKCHCFGHLLDTCCSIGPSTNRAPLLRPRPSIWVRKNMLDVDQVEAEPSIDKATKGKSTDCDEALMKEKDVTSDEETEDDGICWMSDDRAWVHDVSCMRYDPHENEYYKYVSEAVEDVRRLEYQVVGDSFELISEVVLGEKNQSLFHDFSWD